jgi:branched-chain amino acid transport system ATP-binding protein
MTMSDILVVEGVRKSFGQLRAVDEVSFAVRAGEIFGIAGPNGSGKSTLFNIMTAIPFAADGGSVSFDGRRIDRLAPHRICQSGVARTFQKETTFDSLSAYQNVLLGAVYGRGRRDAARFDARARDALGIVGIAETQFDRPAGELSVFDKKRLMIASALATEPRLLLLDEPASGLTKPEVAETADLVRRVNGLGITVLIIEHVLPLLLSLSQRVMVLNQGRELTTGLPDDVMRDERVVEAYLGTRRAHGTARS